MNVTTRTEPPLPSNLKARLEHLMERARRAFGEAFEALPAASLEAMKSTEFGRSIEKQLGSLRDHHGAIKLKLRGQDRAVVVDIELYRELIGLRDTYRELLQLEKERSLAEAGSEFDALMARIQSPATREAVDRTFDAADDELGESYRPGETERQD